jgi:hypothetical protein
VALLFALLLAFGVLAPASAQTRAPAGGEVDVDVNLVLAIDASGSVEDERFELQKRGFAAAFRDPKVLNAIRAGDRRSIAVFMLQWTGPPLQEVMLAWTVISDERSADRVATLIEAAPRRLMGGGTSLSGAIDYSVRILASSPYRATKRVIDISGDGSNNLGRPVEQARDEAVRGGIRINGLPILAVEADLDQYFRQNVIGGPGAFSIPAKSYDQFAQAILRKLVTEISQADTKPARKETVLEWRPFANPLAPATVRSNLTRVRTLEPR